MNNEFAKEELYEAMKQTKAMMREALKDELRDFNERLQAQKMIREVLKKDDENGDRS